MHLQYGFTLLEMLITVAILAILVGVVAPSINTILVKNRVTGDINTLSAIAQQARFSAVNEQFDVILCPTTNYDTCVSDWANAKMVFIDENANGSRDSSESLIASSDPLNTGNIISGISGAISFSEQGSISTSATITICPKSKDASYASALLLSLYGRISVAIDSDNDGVNEDLSGTALTCT
ncbi:Prepilin-type N-terminal cleavage/methylation domain-containing protein [Alteromonas sp. 38]|nr:GspH/FimT family pseudopilin [Alteromonas lipotrueae]CAD5266271.1 Prepilin-type N-terminal cleavage/methylation domain-containing protein [Alteromonas sp. 154]VXC06961.1 Prepilin-type N-terminal cleavage/methylation domain-containing protein [Alteromonas sp. 38]